MRLLRWLVSSPGADDEQKQSWLLSHMFTRTISLVGAAATDLIIAVTATVLHPTIPIVAWLCTGIFLLLWRLCIISAAHRRTAQGRAVASGTLVVSSLAWALELGGGNMLCSMSGEPVLQMLSNACIFPVIAGIGARNTNTPRLALAQMVIATSLTSAGAALAPQLWINVLIIQTPFFLVGLGSICLRAGRDLVSMLDAQQRNAALARHDSLTQLPNRVLMQERLESLLASGASGGFAVVLVDLDGFKAVNDALGHAAGDAVLAETAKRLLPFSAGSDRLAARLGGDEFLLLLPRTGQDEAVALAAAVAAAIRRPFALLNAPDIRLDASIGIALHPEHGGNADTLLAAADSALYAVKATGKARIEVYDPLLHAGDADIVLLRSELARTLSGEDRTADDGELQLHYQPVTRLSDGSLVGREALVRWQHPLRGLVSPGTFIPLAEASGLIIPIGEWVLRRACIDAAQWSDGAKVAVNVSPFQLRSERFIDGVVQALDQARPAARAAGDRGDRNRAAQPR